jgi:hypothetical protein
MHDDVSDYEILSLCNTPQTYASFSAQLRETPPSIKSSFLPKPFSGKATIDSGATSCFIHPSPAQDHRLPTFEHKFPKKLRVIDSREVASGQVTHYTLFSCTIGNHPETLKCHISNIGNPQLVLGMLWPKQHNPTINWDKHLLLFGSPYCSNNCLSKPAILERKGESSTPPPYQEFSRVFSDKESSKLLPHCPFDIAIELLPDAKPCHSPIYSLGPREDQELKETREKQLKAGVINKGK